MDENFDEQMKSMNERLKERREHTRATPVELPHILRDWQAHGLRCLIVNGPMSINGYAYVPEGHPWFKTHYNECPENCGEDWCEHRPESRIEVHGGLTYSNLGHGGWIFGFDTSHYGDMMITPFSIEDGRSWSEEDVAKETEQMAAQLVEVKS